MEFNETQVDDFASFFETIKAASITEETSVLVNRGPGSYSGIRTGISYIYGLLHGNRVSHDHIRSFTSFDLIRAQTGHRGPIFIKAWPRLANGTLDGSKGYLEDPSQKDRIRYVAFEEIAGADNLLSVGEETMSSTFPYRTLIDLLRDPIGYRELAAQQTTLSQDLEPLYINPVHIT